MSGLTDEQRKLCYELQKAITTDRDNVAELLKGVSKDDLLKVLITDGTTIRFKSGKKTTGNLFFCAVVIKNQEGLKAIFGAMKEKNISFGEIMCADGEVISEEFPNVIEFDGTPLKEEQEILILSNALKESGNLKECFIAVISNFKDLPDLEKPISAIVGIAAAVLVGLVAGGITYAVSKPSSKVEKANVQDKESTKEQVLA